MKKVTLVLAILAMMNSCSKHESELQPQTATQTLRSQPVPVSSLPSSILEYTTNSYPELNITQAELDDNEYEVYLSNGLEVIFSLDGVFLGWEAENLTVANAVLPASVLEYIQQNYPTATIDEAAMNGQYIEVEFFNNTELYFDLLGNFLYSEIDN